VFDVRDTSFSHHNFVVAAELMEWLVALSKAKPEEKERAFFEVKKIIGSTQIDELFQVYRIANYFGFDDQLLKFIVALLPDSCKITNDCFKKIAQFIATPLDIAGPAARRLASENPYVKLLTSKPIELSQKDIVNFAMSYDGATIAAYS